MKKAFFVLLMLLSLSFQAVADWIDPGLSYRCDRVKHAFEIASTMDTSSPIDVPAPDLPAGFISLTESRTVKCNLTWSTVTAEFHVRPPQATGMCGGITQNSIESLLVRGHVLFHNSGLFNHYCTNEEALHSVRIVDKRNSTHVEVCYAKWDWDVGYHDKRCESVGDYTIDKSP